MTKMIVLDEASMLDRYQMEALDRTFHDILDSEQPFGGKTLVLSGDFRQGQVIVDTAEYVGLVNVCPARGTWS